MRYPQHWVTELESSEHRHASALLKHHFSNQISEPALRVNTNN